MGDRVRQARTIPPVDGEPHIEALSSLRQQKPFDDYFTPLASGKVEIVLGDLRFWKAETFEKILKDVDRMQMMKAVGYEPSWMEKFGLSVLLAHAQTHGWDLKMPVK